jgi:hypothetical protein
MNSTGYETLQMAMVTRESVIDSIKNVIMLGTNMVMPCGIFLGTKKNKFNNMNNYGRVKPPSVE